MKRTFEECSKSEEKVLDYLVDNNYDALLEIVKEEIPHILDKTICVDKDRDNVKKNREKHVFFGSK